MTDIIQVSNVENIIQASGANTSIITRQSDITLVDTAINQSTITATEEAITTVVTSGIQGPAGVDAATTQTATAGENITASYPVVLIDGEMFHADINDLTHVGKVVGVARQSGLTGVDIEYTLIGEVNFGTDLFITDTRYYIGTGGLTSILPVGSAWIKYMGFAKTPQIFVVVAGPEIIRS